MKSVFITRIVVPIMLYSWPLMSAAQPWYVATNGSDLNDGTKNYPFLTITKAVSVVQVGETIYLRGGTYALATTITISKSGNASSLISLSAYSGERPVLDFSGQPFGNRGIYLSGSYWHIRGIDFTSAGDNGMIIYGGNNNIIENCAFYRNRDSGLQLGGGASNNTIKNCDSYYNADPADYGDADGFAAKLDVGSGNYFYGCRAWKNCDDGWDGYLRDTDNIITTVENCWAFENGYFEDGTDAGVNANGNGFKMGGSDDKLLQHNYTLKNCLTFKNKAKGFDQNNNRGSMILYNCTGHNNLIADYRITQTLATGCVLIVKNCVVLGSNPDIGSFAEQEKNSWMTPFVVTEEDFVSIDETLAYGPRKEDGSLPDIEYMHLAKGSDLIDTGVNVGLPFNGLAPDLGCFESLVTGIVKHRLSIKAVCYPNPVKETGILQFSPDESGRCVILLYDTSGRYIKTLAEKEVEPFEQNISIDISDVQPGLYIYRIMLNGCQIIASTIVKTAS